MLKVFVEDNKCNLISITVENIAEAKSVFMKYRDSLCKASSDYKHFKSGTIEDEQGNFIAKISYNGRIWKDKKWTSSTEEIIIDEVA